MANAKIVNTPSQAIAQSGTAHTQRVVNATAATLINWTLNTNTQHVVVQFNGGTTRVTFDGSTSPTSSIGFLYLDGGTAYWTRQMAINAKVIRGGATNVIAEIQELNFL